MTNLGVNLLLAVISTLAALGALELWAGQQVQGTLTQRLAGRTNPGESRCYEQDLHMGTVPIPGTCDFNMAGMRATSNSLSRPAHTRRVLLLGDSVMEMYHIPLDFQQALQSRHPGVGVEVWNAGVSGFDTCNELWMLKERGLALDPDVVVLGFVTNDWGVDAVLRPLEGGRVELRLGRQHWQMPSWFLHSHLLVWATLRYRSAEVTRQEDTTPQVSRCLRALARACEENEIPLVVMLWPALSPRLGVAPASSPRELAHQKGEEAARQLLANSGIPWIDLRPHLEAVKPLEAYRNDPTDGIHPDPEARRLGAEVVAEWIKQRGWPGHLGSQAPSQ